MADNRLPAEGTLRGDNEQKGRAKVVIELGEFALPLIPW